uniref:Uncharacterized protein n=1 Tax=Anguilla anguilla TaxID=7936 RepID=A0A0E9V4T6_ANGAN
METDRERETVSDRKIKGRRERERTALLTSPGLLR